MTSRAVSDNIVVALYITTFSKEQEQGESPTTRDEL